jgi:GNAT superfamily N-acetyltransferase
MQPEQALPRIPDEEWQRGMIMERVILDVRRLWFSSHELPLGHATAVVEPGGEMVMFVDGEPDEVDAVIATAAVRGAYVVATTFNRPADLALRLQRAGFRPLMRQAAYVWEAAGAAAPEAGTGRRGLLGWFHWREAPRINVRQIGPEGLESWNRVCWRAFGRRGGEADSLREKVHAFRSMGVGARWYLADIGGRPAGTGILYQGEQAAQILAIGTEPFSRGRGVASAILRRIFADWRQAAGHGFLFLDTNPGSSAERLYQHLGFRQAYVREVYGSTCP